MGKNSIKSRLNSLEQWLKGREQISKHKEPILKVNRRLTNRDIVKGVDY